VFLIAGPAFDLAQGEALNRTNDNQFLIFVGRVFLNPFCGFFCLLSGFFVAGIHE
jgi:hypothetical protein